MHYKANRIYSFPLKVAKRCGLPDTAWKLYVELHETYGLEYWMPLDEAAAKMTLHPDEFIVALESLIFHWFHI